jgi:glutamate synthase (NADPH/NADH) small chain
VFRADWKNAIDTLHSTNNFPEFTGPFALRPCEAACVLNVNDEAVGIKSIEHASSTEPGLRAGHSARQHKTKIAVVGSVSPEWPLR